MTCSVSTVCAPGIGAAEVAAAGRDVLAVLPTGLGKSAIYQLAALARPGPTEGGVANAGHVNSDLSAGDRCELFEALGDGDFEFLPGAEQLARGDVVAELREARPSLFVVDEAHCISSWGHDFRPDYRRVARREPWASPRRKRAREKSLVTRFGRVRGGAE